MAAPHISGLYVEKIQPGEYAVSVGDHQAFDVFVFPTERDADRFVRASGYAFKRTRARS